MLSTVGLILLGVLGIWGHSLSPPRTVDEYISAALEDKRAVYGPIHHEDGTVLVEMDMRLTKEQYDAIHGHKSARNGLRDDKYRWTNNIIPYLISSYFSDYDKKEIRAGMDEWEKYTCLKFIERTNEDNFVNIIAGTGCWSMVGMNGGRQDLSLQLGACVYHHTIVHELGHAVGFHHEQTRPDRDTYLTVYRDNIIPGLEYNFDKYDWDLVSDFGIKYDYWSVMHYGQYAFSGNGKKTMEPTDREYDTVIGSVPGLSFKDIQMANKMYKCGDKCTTTCPAKSIVTKDCKCWCNNNNPASPVVDWDGTGDCLGGDDITETCMDYHDDCQRWATEGECTKNGAWMAMNCRKACRVCGPNPACFDYDNNCPYWAMIGECERNAGWMLTNCQFSCKVCGNHTDPGDDCEDRWDLCVSAAAKGDCETHSASMLKQCPKSCRVCGDDKVCKNWDSLCERWEEKGRCSSDPEFMNLNCPEACGKCTGNLPWCRDYANPPDCKWWADNGECGSNPGWMLWKCPKSCLICGDDKICLDRDVSCGYWAAMGHCQSEFEYMSYACRHTCGLCENNEDTAECGNFDHNCKRWADAGECEINPDGMLYFCPRECGVCGDNIECKDWHDDCESWSKTGECEHNRAWMVMHCRKACDCCNDKKECSPGTGGPGPGECDHFVEGDNCDDYGGIDCPAMKAQGKCNDSSIINQCRVSCGLCGDYCLDQDLEEACKAWAMTGECLNNPGFMEMSCRKSCRCCEEPESAEKKKQSDCDFYTEENCGDFRPDCEALQQNGTCTVDGDVVNQCRTSCGLCGGDYCLNVDLNESCSDWADNGDCENNPSYMQMYCRQSCACCQ